MDKLLLLIPLVFLSACSHQDPWVSSSILSGISDYNFSKLSYPPSDIVNGFQLEMTCNQEDLNLYLNVFTHQISRDSQKVKVTFSSENTVYECEADLLEGGQRIRFTQRQLPHILEHLLQSEETTIQFACYEQTLDTVRFQKHLKELKHTRYYSLPHEWIGLSF